eukprot:11257540-Alexandrium_andersonii.AAC.1
MAGLAPTLRPHARPIWKILADQPGGRAEPASRNPNLLFSGPVNDCLLWAASLLRVRGDLQRTYAIDWGAPAEFFVAADASP